MDTINPLKLHKRTHGVDCSYKQEQKDFCIKVEDETIHVNKAFLCTVSEYFRVMVESGMTESEGGILDVKKTKPHVVQTIIKYFHGEKVSIPWDEVKGFVDFVELWQIPELKSKLEEYITKHVSASDCIELYHLADMYLMEPVKTKTIEILLTDFVDAFKSQYFKGLDYEDLVVFIKNKELRLSPDAVLEACITWTMAEESARRPTFDELLTYVLISKCNPLRLRILVDKHKLVTSQSVSAQINDIITSSIIFITMDFPGSNHKAVALNTNDCSHVDLSKWLLKLSFFHKSLTVYTHFKTRSGIFSSHCSRANQFECILWDPASLEVTQFPPITLDSFFGIINVASVNNQIYVMGRQDRKSVLFQINTKSGEQWEKIRLPKSVKKASQSLICSHEKFVFTLSVDDYDDVMLHCYDTEHDTWDKKTSPHKYFHDFMKLTCVVPALGCLYFLGNFQRQRPDGESKGLQKLCLRYSIASDTWNERSRPPKKSKLKKAVLLETRGEIYEFIGSTYSYEDRMQVYSIAANRWRDIPCTIPVNVQNAFCFSA